MKERIEKILKLEQLTASRFADIIDVQRSNVSHILSGRNNPGLDFIQKILSEFTNINAEWLLLGNGEMYKKEEQISSLNQDYENDDNIKNINKNIPSPDNKEKAASSSIQDEPGKKKVEKITYFYSDKTFKEYYPNI